MAFKILTTKFGQGNKIMFLSKSKLLFWDFDGVIKDSLDVKTEAYYNLFKPFGKANAEKVKAHHLNNGGISRFEKMPIYLKWVGEPNDDINVESYCQQFSDLVFDGVVNAPWIRGVKDFLIANKNKKISVLVTGTPDDEIKNILAKLKISSYFDEVYGSPLKKEVAIKNVLNKYNFNCNDCLMIGDALSNYKAANLNGIPFLLTNHKYNKDLFKSYNGPSVLDFLNYE